MPLEVALLTGTPVLACEVANDAITLVTPAERIKARAVVNAAGVLQDGAHDRVHDVQSRAMRASWRSCRLPTWCLSPRSSAARTTLPAIPTIWPKP